MTNATCPRSEAVLDEELRRLMADVIAEEPQLLDAECDSLERWYFELDSVGSWLAAQPRAAWKQAKELCPVCGSTELETGEGTGETKLKPYLTCLGCNTMLSWG